MKISIVTVCFNADEYIEEALESVLTQRGDFLIEYVVIDGGSSDGTLGIVGRSSRELARGIRPVYCRGIDLACVSERDAGFYDGLAKGLRRATGDVVAWINADDFYLPHAFATVIDVLRAFPEVRWLTGMTVNYNAKGQITGIRLPIGYRRDLIRKGLHGTVLPFIQQESTFFRRDLLDRVDLQRLQTLRYAGDYFLWHAFADVTDLYTVESCLAGFRRRQGQISSDRERYMAEFRSIADTATPADRVTAWCLRRMDRLLTNPDKRRWSGKIIHWRGAGWEKGP